MRFRLSVLFICFASLVQSQNQLPRYLDVARHFFRSYSHNREDYFDRIYFAKKKEGWYVNIVDISKNEEVKSGQLFWDIQAGQYIPLKGFGEGLTDAEVDEKIETFLAEDYSFKVYEAARCRYFGYNTWDVDMIRDFGAEIPANDTIVEGLARAYAFYAERYLWSGFGGTPYDNDPLKTKLGTIEIPGKERVSKFIYYINKSIECYKILESRNPGYKLKVGTPGIKIINEQFHAYQQLMLCGYDAEAKKIMGEIPGDDPTYLALGYAYLSSCPLNSILITDGDNDTYPLWLLQEKKGFRKDVLVLNTSMLGFSPYINMLKKKYPALFSATANFYGKDKSSIFYYQKPASAAKKPASTLQQLVKDIHSGKDKTDDSITIYNVSDISFNIDVARFKKICDQPGLKSSMKIQLKNYLFLSDVMIMDIIKTNLYSKPICFGFPPGLIDKEYFLQEAFVYRLVPLNEGAGNILRKAEVLKIESYLKQYGKPVIARYKSVDGGEYFENMTYGKLSNLYAGLILYYLGKDDGKKKADEWVTKFIEIWKPANLRFTAADLQVALAIFNSSYKQEGVRIMEKIARDLIEDYRTNDASPSFYKKEEYLDWLNYIKNLLESKDASTVEIDKLMRELDK